MRVCRGALADTPTRSGLAQHAASESFHARCNDPPRRSPIVLLIAVGMHQRPLPDVDAWAAVSARGATALSAHRDLCLLRGYRTDPRELNTRPRPDVRRAATVRPVSRLHGGSPPDADGRPPRTGHNRRRVRAALGHALSFTTWRSLVREQGCTEKESASCGRQCR